MKDTEQLHKYSVRVRRMDVLSLSTEATYGADSKCHMFMEDAVFVQCLFLRPNNLWKITVLSNIAVGGPLILSFKFSVMYPEWIRTFSRPFRPNSAIWKIWNTPYPDRGAAKLGCVSYSAPVLNRVPSSPCCDTEFNGKMVVFTCVVLSVGLLERCGCSQAGKRLEFRCLTFLFPCPSARGVTLTAALLLGGVSGSCCFSFREQR